MQKEVLVLTRKNDEVFFGSTKLTIVAQASKGSNKEVVKIAGLPNSNGQKWVSLAKLQQGSNVLACKAKEVTTSSYSLTADEVKKVNELQSQIDAIKEAAKARYIAKPNLNLNVQELTKEQRIAEVEKIKKYYGL